MSDVVRHVCDAIGPASVAQGEAARVAVSGAGAPMLERLAFVLGGAQHAPRPRAERRMIVVAAADHGCGDPGLAMGAGHPTVIAGHAIAAGTAALCQVARAARTPILVIDAGVREPDHLPASVVALRRGASRDLMREPAMSRVDTVLGLEAGIALAVSLSEAGHGATEAPEIPASSIENPSDNRVGDTQLRSDHQGGETHVREPFSVLALGAIGVGSEVASAAILGAVTGVPPTGLRDDLAEHAGARGAAMAGASGIELLAAFGGGDTAVLAGLILGAASMNVPVILDGYATGAAALVAAALAPNVTGYLVAAHRGSFTHPPILAHLGLVPIFDVGLGHGEGTGAAMILPLVDQVASIARRR